MCNQRAIYHRFFVSLLGGFLVLTAGCATSNPPAEPSAGIQRNFSFPEDTFAFANELELEYTFDDDGGWHTSRKNPPVEYSQRCFPLSRTAREFFYHARFDPASSRASEPEYRELIRTVIRRNSRQRSSAEERVLIPGFVNLHSFSAAYPDLFRSECGEKWQSYLQRGNWRMVFPFTHRHQSGTAAEITEMLDHGELPIVHVVTFPSLALNHGLMVFDYVRTGDKILFLGYDPNDPTQPIEVNYDSVQRQFCFPGTDYFRGGDVNLYLVYKGICY